MLIILTILTLYFPFSIHSNLASAQSDGYTHGCSDEKYPIRMKDT